MKSFFTIFLAVLFGGCYTQVKSSGDYWGYTGHHERAQSAPPENYAPDTTAAQPFQDSSNYSEDQRTRSDEGYDPSTGNLIYNDPYNGGYNPYAYSGYAPYYGYGYTPYDPYPSFGFSVGYGGWGGWHGPWWTLGFGYGYSNPYWYSDPYWNWWYSPSFAPYGCYSPFYSSYY